MRAKLTKTAIEAALPKTTEYRIMDLEVPGFGVRVRPHGGKSYFLQWTLAGRLKRVGLGRAIGKGAVTVDAARAKARTLRQRILNDGADPIGERRERREAATVDELCDAYIESGMGHKKPSTVTSDIGRINTHIRPLIGKRLVRDLKKSDIKSVLTQIAAGKTATERSKTGKLRGRSHVRGGKGTAVRTVDMLSAILSFAVERGDIAANPALGVERYPTRKIRNFPTEEVLVKLAAYFDKMGGQASAMITLFVLTGCRAREIEDLQWGYVHLEAPAHFSLPDSKTGAKVVPLGAPAVSLLQALKPEEAARGDWVFPSPRDPSRPYRGLASVWRRHRDAAGCAGYRRHDLRHAFGATATRLGASLRQVGGMLGHADVRTSAIYAHLTNSDVARIADQTAQRLVEVMSGKKLAPDGAKSETAAADVDGGGAAPAPLQKNAG